MLIMIFLTVYADRTMRRIAILDHIEHSLLVEDINEQELEEKYNGEEEKYIEDNYSFAGEYSWEWITDTEYYPEGQSEPVDVEFTDWV